MNERIRYLGATNQRDVQKRTVQVKKENDPDISFSVSVVHRKALILCHQSQIPVSAVLHSCHFKILHSKGKMLFRVCCWLLDILCIGIPIFSHFSALSLSFFYLFHIYFLDQYTAKGH